MSSMLRAFIVISLCGSGDPHEKQEQGWCLGVTLVHGTGGTWRPRSAGLTRKDKLIESVCLYTSFYTE